LKPFYKRVILLVVGAAAGGALLATVANAGRAPGVTAPTPTAAASAASTTAASTTAAAPAQSSAGDAAPADSKFDELQQRLSTNPADADALSQVAAMYLGAKRYGQAADLFAQVVDIDPQKAEYHTGYGIALFYAGMQQLGAKELRRAVELDPNNVEAQFNFGLAVSHGASADFEAANRAWQEVVRLDPDGQLGLQAKKMLASTAGAAPN
jgi:cytochrome c-type biogenesis protein CcmH/NrfG